MRLSLLTDGPGLTCGVRLSGGLWAAVRSAGVRQVSQPAMCGWRPAAGYSAAAPPGRGSSLMAWAGESVRACLEALAVAAPDWLAGVIDVPDWAARYPARTVSWRLPKSKTERDRLAAGDGADGFALLNAVYAGDAAGMASRPARGRGTAHDVGAELHVHR